MKFFLRLSIIIVFTICLSNYGFGQITRKLNYTLSMDTAKTQVLPFDIPFTVRMEQNIEDPFRYLYLIKLNRYGNLIEDKQTSFRDEGIFPLKLLSTEKVEGKEFLYVDIPALKPDKRYMLFAVTTRRQNLEVKKILQVYCKDPSLVKDEKINWPVPNYFENDPTVPEDEIELPIPREKIIMQIIDNSECKICEQLNKEQEKANLVNTSDKKLEIKYSYEVPQCDTCYKGSIRELAFITGLTSLLELRKAEILDGTYKLDTLESKKRPVVVTIEAAGKDAQRITNIQSSLAILSVFRQSLLYVRSLYPASSFGTTYTNNLNVIEEYMNIMKTNIVSLQNVVSNNNKTNNEIESCLNKIDLPLGWEFNRVRGGTSSYSFYTRNAFFIKPDYGVVYYSDKLFSNPGFSGAAPFVGFHINFKATNENIPFWTNFDILRLPTLQIGVPVFAQNLSQDGSRRHLVADKFSIFTGIGINLGHTARLHYGALWFQALQSGQGSDLRYNVTNVHYIGFSIDIKLRKLFTGLSEAISGVNGVPGF